MKKIFIMLMMAFSFLTISAQGFIVEGNNYVSTSSRSVSNYIETPYTYRGKTIWINKTNGRCVTKSPSPTKRNTDGTPKINTSAIPEDVAKDVARKMNVPYTYVKKSRN